AEPGEAVGEEPDGFVVAEVGRTHPALGLLAAYAPALAGLLDGELGAAAGLVLGPDDDAGRRRGRAGGPGRGDDLGHGEGQFAQTRTGRRADGEYPQPAGPQVGDHHVGDLLAVGHIDLVEGDQPRTVLEPAVAGQLVLDDVEVGHRFPPGLHRRGVDDVDQRRAALDVA